MRVSATGSLFRCKNVERITRTDVAVGDVADRCERRDAAVGSGSLRSDERVNEATFGQSYCECSFSWYNQTTVPDRGS